MRLGYLHNVNLYLTNVISQGDMIVFLLKNVNR